MPWTTIPDESRLKSDASTAFFHDSFESEYFGQEKTAIALAAQLARQTPAWFEWLMAVRNRAASAIGLKNLGRFDAVDKDPAAYRVGDRLGIFVIQANEPQEIVLVENDKHLCARVSVHLAAGAPRTVTVTTMVHIHNVLGYAYIALVLPVHRLVTPPFVSKAKLLP